MADTFKKLTAKPTLNIPAGLATINEEQKTDDRNRGTRDEPRIGAKPKKSGLPGNLKRMIGSAMLRRSSTRMLDNIPSDVKKVERINMRPPPFQYKPSAEILTKMILEAAEEIVGVI